MLSLVNPVLNDHLLEAKIPTFSLQKPIYLDHFTYCFVNIFQPANQDHLLKKTTYIPLWMVFF